MSGRVLGVDPGEKRIGVALSDPTATLASRLAVIQHTSRAADAAAVARLAAENEAALIVIGQPLDENGLAESPEARRSARFAEAVRALTDIAVALWDESMSTSDAQSIRRAMGVSRRKRQGHLDDLAAAVMLQSYLDAQSISRPDSSPNHFSEQGNHP